MSHFLISNFFFNLTFYIFTTYFFLFFFYFQKPLNLEFWNLKRELALNNCYMKLHILIQNKPFSEIGGRLHRIAPPPDFAYIFAYLSPLNFLTHENLIKKHINSLIKKEKVNYSYFMQIQKFSILLLGLLRNISSFFRGQSRTAILGKLLTLGSFSGPCCACLKPA